MEYVKRSSRLQSLTTWPFLLSLAVLLLNDLYLKAAYNNWLTGKISDFAGLFMVTMLTAALLPGYQHVKGLLVALAFGLWKSPLSEPIIRIIQSHWSTHFGRVVDYSDLVAVIMIPFAIISVNNPRTIAVSGNFLRRALTIPVLILALFAIMGTSFATIRQEYVIQKADDTPCPDPEEVMESIDKVAKAQGLVSIGRNTAPEKGKSGETIWRLEYSGNGIKMLCRVDELGSTRFFVMGIPSGGLFFRHYPEKEMALLQNALKSELGNRFKDMEFIVPLNPTK